MSDTTKIIIYVGVGVLLGAVLYYLYEKYKKRPTVICPICPLTPGCPQGNDAMTTLCWQPFVAYLDLLNNDISTVSNNFYEATLNVPNIKSDPMFMALIALNKASTDLLTVVSGQKPDPTVITSAVHSFLTQLSTFPNVTPGKDVANILSKDFTLNYLVLQLNPQNYTNLQYIWKM